MTNEASPAQVPALSEELGPLPKANYTLASGGSLTWLPGYSVDETQAYALKALRRLAVEAKQYMESAQVQLESEFGVGRDLDELIADKDMPDLYWRLCAILRA